MSVIKPSREMKTSTIIKLRQESKTIVQPSPKRQNEDGLYDFEQI